MPSLQPNNINQQSLYLHHFSSFLPSTLLQLLLQQQSESQSNLSLMNLIDHYGGCTHPKEQQSQQQKRGQKHQDANVPLILLALKDKISLTYPDDYVSLVDCRQMSHGRGGECMLEYLQRKAYNRQYQFYFQVNFYSTLYLLNIRGTFIKNGLFVHLPSKERILMTIRVLNNLNREINPLKLIVNQFSGEISLEHSSFIDANLADFRFKRNLITLTYRIYFIIELMMKYRYIVLFYIEGDVHFFSKSQVEFGEKQYMEEVENKMAGIEKKLMQICFKTYNQRQEVDSDLRKKSINPNVQYLTESTEAMIDIFTSQKKQHQPSVISQLANEKYKQQHIQTFMTKQEEKFGFRINNKVEFVGVPEWKREDCGGYGIILTAMFKFKLLDHENPNKRQKEASQMIFEEKIAMKIDKSEKGNSRIAAQKEIVTSIGHLSHPNITTYFHKAKTNENCLYSLWQENSSLKHYISRMPNISIYQMLQMMQQAAKGLYFLHKHNIVHVDFKPANIIVGRKFLIKLTDFGESHLLTKPVYRLQLSYTFPYASPEIFSLTKTGKKDNKQLHITPQADVYSLGVTIYKCFFGDYIWGSRLKQYKSSRCSPFVIPCIVPESFRDAGQQRVATMIAYLCLRCMEKQPQSRAKLPWVITILQECRLYLSSLHYR